MPTRLSIVAVLLLAGLATACTHVMYHETPYTRGVVFDAETDRPIPAASIKVEGREAETVTSASGEFTLQPITRRMVKPLFGSPQPKTIIVSAPGYVTLKTLAFDGWWMQIPLHPVPSQPPSR